MHTFNDITIVYYTANAISDKFAFNTQYQLLKAAGDIPIISVSKKPMDFGENIDVGDSMPRNHFSIYRQALIGAIAAETEFIALCEDDVLYSPEHFKYRPKNHPFAYNLGAWSIYTWHDPAIYTHKGKVRRNLNSLICNRRAFINAMEERFAKYPDDSKIDKDIWAEPGKYERQLGVTVQETEEFYTNPPNIIFSHETELSFAGLGTRKRPGEFRAYSIPYWGEAERTRGLYEDL